MSDNSYYLINKRTFEVTRNDADSDEVISKLGKGKDLISAIELAEADYPPAEYGIHFYTDLKEL
ncbi:MAG: hypothetical protein KCHDKBKB_00728 [Elusimicrobia bacterium]|nr:hypothetical protein [Elusimicrobiota bacterium]